MKVEKIISHIRFKQKGDYVYSKERLYEKLNIENNKNINLRIGEIINYENSKYKILNIQFVIISNEWGLYDRNNERILKLMEEEQDVSPTNSEILIEIEKMS